MMLNITTTDNNMGCTLQGNKKLRCDNVFSKDNYNDLLSIANIPLKNLKENIDPHSFLIFPDSLSSNNDGIGELPIFNMYGSPDNLDTVRIETNNLVGFVGYKDTKLNIRSRFSWDSGNDYFVQYMLEKVFDLNLLSLENSVSFNGQLDILPYLFPKMLENSLRQGIYKTYQNFERNDSKVRGVIDLSRHISKNIPFVGNIAYNSRERTSDNYLLELIRHTIEVIKLKPYGRQLLSSNVDIKNNVDTIVQITQDYNLRDRDYIISKNLIPVIHPYFTEYAPLQQLCLSILRFEKIQYEESETSLYGILFDIAWLWEEYLWTILKDKGFKHPRNKEHDGGIKMFKKPSDEDSFSRCYRKIYPDFYKDHEIILDAKYKHLESGAQRDDLYQVISYMHTMEIDKGGFIYPSNDSQETKTYSLTGDGGEISTIGYYIPENAVSYKEFINKLSINKINSNQIHNG